MAYPSLGPASLWAQGNALLRKNLTFQKRNVRANLRLVLIPVIFFALFAIAQYWVDKVFKDTPAAPAVRKPPPVAPLLQVPAPWHRAVRNDILPFTDLPDASCLQNGTCPVTVLLTGNNQTFGKSFAGNLFTSSATYKESDVFDSLAYDTFGSDLDPQVSDDDMRFVTDSAFIFDNYIYEFQPRCTLDYPFSKAGQTARAAFGLEVTCVQALSLWRNSSAQINEELFKGHWKGNPKGAVSEIMIAYDLLNSDAHKFNVSIWYNSTYSGPKSKSYAPLRVPRSVNLATNAYLQSFLGRGARILFDFVKEMPKPESLNKPDISAMFGTLFFTWIIVQLFPVILTSLVYEKQQKLRIIMKMHGLGDFPYWTISYAYFLAISSFYMLCFVGCGTILDFKFFTLNNYGIQMVFYFIYINVQIAFAFLVAAIFSNVKTATVVAYILVFATGLTGLVFQSFVEDASFPRDWIIMLELYPGFSLYRGVYEFGQYSAIATSVGSDGMQWVDLSDKVNGIREVLIIMVVEWFVVLFIAYYVDQVVAAGGGVKRSPLFFLQKIMKKPQSSIRNPSFQRSGSEFSVQIDKTDVAQEREKVEQLLREPSKNYAIICDSLKKVYPGKDGNPEKFAVKGLSLALPRGECFGMLGPNGAGKTSFISMMIGLAEPSSGTAFVQGLDIRNDMDGIYTSMGVCPQHDLLWETLTGREHLLFYGRLKNLKGAALTNAVEDSLKSVNLFGVADKQAGKYSGGMKRRLSVAISLIGDPKVVYMDEPSTGLDPASRNLLWNVVKRAKEDRAVILTTHSMEEAEHLCDRLGIFVDGSLQCIGNPNELKGRYGGSYVFTMTTSPNHEGDVEDLVRRLSPSALRTYRIPGTQKFELPKNEVNIADVFQAVEDAKKRFTVQAWGLADTTMEDVFIKVAREAQAFKVLS